MTLIILAAGYAVRLQPLTLNTSKSLLSVGNKKIIDRILEKVFRIKDISAIYIITNSKFFKNFSDWLKASKHENKISLICDGTTTNENRLGAIKDLEFVIKEEFITGDIMVVAGDNLFEFDLNSFLAFARKKDGVSIAVHDIGSLELAKNYGVVKTDADQRVVDFEEKPQDPKSTLISTGIYYFPKNKVAFINEYVKMQDKLDAPGNYIGWIAKRDKVYGFAFSEDWYDIGGIESYRKADEAYQKKADVGEIGT
ncbi:MAG: nucleotidyltransferase family protein [Candidatus Omnitrophica bacterium]|nr:nucleotidyltransferase family protein [Candidatus Omnitrophota bacterium]MDD5437026.1 nucleotidyltransferase family protein [Candidatus Omnitrophota bacterium]